MNSENGTYQYLRYSMLIEWSNEDDAYIVTVPELPGCITHGATYEVAMRQGQDAIGSWIEVAHELSRPVPDPGIFVSGAV